MSDTKTTEQRKADSLVVLRAEELRELIEETIENALADRDGASSPLMDRQAAARFLDVSIAQLDRLQREKNLPVHRVGEARRYDKSELRAWVLAQPPEVER